MAASLNLIDGLLKTIDGGNEEKKYQTENEKIVIVGMFQISNCQMTHILYICTFICFII